MMSSSLAASNADDPPPGTNNQPPSPSLFSSLPIDIVWNILARVPKRYHPIICCVSKNLRYLVRSPEIHRIRSLLGKDSLYICFVDRTGPKNTRNWFTLGRIENNPTENHFAAAADLVFPYDSEPNPSTIAIGPEIFFICGSYFPSSSLWIFDTRSREFRRGPCMIEDRLTNTAGLVGGKIYVIGGYRGDEIQAESFDLKTQTWDQAPDPEDKGSWDDGSTATVSLDKKVYALMRRGQIAVHYDTRDGSCGSFELPKDDKWCEAGASVIANVLYVYYARFGLMWYDSELMLWRVVNGLSHLNKVRCVGMAEYYGKMAVLWEESSGVSGETKEVWCRMIGLERSGVGIHGTAETPQLLGSVPRGYSVEYCLSVSD